ncbi:MAG TPA: hypothetical protein VK787_06650 [Puia sp.]|nr:hypothetical protein [Puia sp.]
MKNYLLLFALLYSFFYSQSQDDGNNSVLYKVIFSDTKVTVNQDGSGGTKLADAGLIFVCTNASVTGKAHKISFLHIIDNKNTQKYAAAKVANINISDNGKDYYISDDDLTNRCSKYYSKHAIFNIGFSLLPYVIRAGGNGRPSDADLSVNTLPSLQIKWRFSHTKPDAYYGFLITAGLMSANIDKGQFPSSSTQAADYATQKNISLISANIGAFVGFKDGSFGVFFGLPFPPKNLTEWNYYHACVLSFGIGISIFSLTNTSKTTSGTSTQPSTKAAALE